MQLKCFCSNGGWQSFIFKKLPNGLFVNCSQKQKIIIKKQTETPKGLHRAK